MLGKRSNQRGLFEADTMYLEFVGPDSFYGYLASERGRLFKDEDFADLYCRTNARDSVPPSLLATALVLLRLMMGSATLRQRIVPTTTCAGRWLWARK